MKRRAPGPLAALLAALAVGVVFAGVGDYVPELSFDIPSTDISNFSPRGITWDGTNLWVVDYYDKIHAFTMTGTYVSAKEIDLASGNGAPAGITWDGTYLRVVDQSPSKLYTYTTAGTHVSAQDFTLSSDNGTPGGVTWDGAYFYMPDLADDKVYRYTAAGATDFNFDLATANDSGYGITWNGIHLRVINTSPSKVFTYTTAGTHVSAQDFTFHSDSDLPFGITHDDTYLRVVNSSPDRVFTYEGVPISTGPLVNYGLSDDVEYAASVSTGVVAYGDWKCVRSATGEALRINNAEVTLHGFCAQPKGSDGMEVELHLSSTAEYADLKRFADVTGHWWFLEVGAPAIADLRIYDDNLVTEPTAPAAGATATPTPEAGVPATGTLAFTERLGGLESSDRLGFATMAKAVEDTNCTETDGVGFVCDGAYLETLTTSDEAVLLFSLMDDNKVEFADAPTIPESLSVSRNADFTTATVTWELYDAVTVYEIQRLTAVQVDVADASRIEYGDPVTFTIEGTQAGIDEYVDSTLEAHRTYQYRMRARGGDITSWSGWTDQVFSGARPDVDLAAPGNLELDRGEDSVVASWSAPTGSFDNYTLQRQEVIVTGSTIFGNIVTLGGATWLPGDTTTYTDTSIIPSQIYEYRIAAVKDDQVGVYSEWFRIAPPNISLGAEPPNFTMLDADQRVFDERREFWVGWDAVSGADDYQVQVMIFDVANGGRSLEEHIVTDPSYFRTSYGRVGIRVRGRKLDTDICSSADDNRCLTKWTKWADVRFTPVETVETPDLADDTTDESIMSLREDTEELFEELLGAAGSTVDGASVIQFVVVSVAVVVAGLSVALSWQRGMAPLGVGMGAAILILVLFTGYRLFGIPLAWPVAAQVLVAVTGVFALVRQTGVLR